MTEIRSRQVVIAGAGIAGLTAALAFARRGFLVQIFERAEHLDEVGAGLQLSPNATRILARLGVLPALMPAATRPEAVVLRDASTLAELARVPLGVAGEKRWKAPYLVAHRADLQSALVSAVARELSIRLVTGATVRDVALHRRGVTASVDVAGTVREASGLLLVGADGVWSGLRGLAGDAGRSRFSGEIAWRATLRVENVPAGLATAGVVTAFVHPGFHLIAYPVRGGTSLNLAAFTRGDARAEGWSSAGDDAALRAALAGTAPALAALAEAASPWAAWPVHTVDPGQRWVAEGCFALIGDAAHAMTPFAAQGAAMAIEDAETLAAHIAADAAEPEAALRRWKPRAGRVARVRRRGAVNRFAWHASGPVAMARDLFLKLRGAEALAADLDWLYGWEPPAD